MRTIFKNHLKPEILKKNVFLLIFLSLFFVPGNLFSQISSKRIEDTGFLPSGKGTSDGTVLLKHDVRIFSIINKQIDVNNDKFPGWRVQIYFGSGSTASQKASEIRNKYQLAYGNDHGTYIVYEDPYFKLRIGDFRTRAEALKYREDISKKIKNTWIVQDNINYPDNNE